jgi:hypothetical protein
VIEPPDNTTAYSTTLSGYITRPVRATLLFAARLAVRAEGFLGAVAPVGAAGELVVLAASIIHFLAPEVAAG